MTPTRHNPDVGKSAPPRAVQTLDKIFARCPRCNIPLAIRRRLTHSYPTQQPCQGFGFLEVICGFLLLLFGVSELLEYLIMPRSDTACFQVFLNALSRKFARQDILLILDGAPNHRCRDLVLPGNISLLFLPPYSPELNPKENLWEEIREKIFKNCALKSIDAVRAKLKQAILYIERNPKMVKSITSFPYIRKSF